MALPTGNLVPGVFNEIDGSKADGGVSAGGFDAVIIAQRTSAGTVSANDYTIVNSDGDGQTKCGVGSIASNMLTEWFKNNSTPVYVALLDDDGGAVSATRELTFTGPATEAGTIFLYINGTLIRVGVDSGDTETDIATNTAAAITANVTLPYTATSALGVVTCTAKNGGTIANNIDVRVNYNVGEALPAGVTFAAAVGTTGATDPDISTAIAAIPDETVAMWISSLSDTTSLGLLKAELDDRWLETSQLYGTAFFGVDQAASSAVVAIGDAQNSAQLCGVESGTDNPTPAYLKVAQVSAKCALTLAVDPARPATTLEVEGALADKASDRYSDAERNLILQSGISTTKTDSSNTVRIERMVTTYKKNGAGADDTAFQNLNTVYQLRFMSLSFINWILVRYPRHKLADDGITYGAGQFVVTPNDLKAAAIGWYDALSELAIVDPAKRALFIEETLFWRDATNRSRVNDILSPTLIGQFYQLASLIQFRK
jgi:phage tail sheath gpL-like